MNQRGLVPGVHCTPGPVSPCGAELGHVSAWRETGNGNGESRALGPEERGGTMDGLRFDDLARRAASGASRRNVIKGLAAGFTATLLKLGNATGSSAQNTVPLAASAQPWARTPNVARPAGRSSAATTPSLLTVRSTVAAMPAAPVVRTFTAAAELSAATAHVAAAAARAGVDSARIARRPASAARAVAQLSAPATAWLLTVNETVVEQWWRPTSYPLLQAPPLLRRRFHSAQKPGLAQTTEPPLWLHWPCNPSRVHAHWSRPPPPHEPLLQIARRSSESPHYRRRRHCGSI